MKVSEILNLLETSDNQILVEGATIVKNYLKNNFSLINDINEDILHNSAMHGKAHAKRTVILGTLLAAKENLNKSDYKLLLAALKYHDIGRVNDYIDDEHGLRSAEKYNGLCELQSFKNSNDIQSREDIEIIMHAMKYHSINDSYLKDIKDKTDAYSQRLYKITALLKDADNLDRVRVYDLDIKFLRHTFSVDSVNFAKELFFIYNN